MSSSKKIDFAAGVYLSEAPSPPRFLFEVIQQICIGSESGKIQSVKLLQNMVSTTVQQPHPLPATHCLYLLWHREEGGGMILREG